MGVSGASQRLHLVNTAPASPADIMRVLLAALALAAACTAAPQFVTPPPGQIMFGVDANGCTVAATGIVCPSGPIQFTSAAQGVPQPVEPPRPTQQHRFSAPVHRQPAPPAHHNRHVPFTGLVGPSGVIGPSGLVGPSGPVAFGR